MAVRYQVFISSTYEDLKQERAEVMQALLELDCIPCGMELFPANDDEQFQYIKGVIEESDYYILIVAGKYGSINPESGLSYTEMEYDFAVSIGRPILSFVFEDIEKLTALKIEVDALRREKFAQFREKIKANRLCKFWNSTSDLGAKVSRGITQIIRQKPAVGWVRMSDVEKTNNEKILLLENTVLNLQRQLDDERATKRDYANTSINDDEILSLIFYIVRSGKMNIEKGVIEGAQRREIKLPVAWSLIIQCIANTMTAKTREEDIYSIIVDYFQKNNKEIIQGIQEIAIGEGNIGNAYVTLNDLGLLHIRAKLIAAGFIMAVPEQVEPRGIEAVPWRNKPTGRVEKIFWTPTVEGARYFANRAVFAFNQFADSTQSGEK